MFAQRARKSAKTSNSAMSCGSKKNKKEGLKSLDYS